MQKVDETVMDKLLNEPSIKEKTKKMSLAELAFFKKLLVDQGIVKRYEREQLRKK